MGSSGVSAGKQGRQWLTLMVFGKMGCTTARVGGFMSIRCVILLLVASIGSFSSLANVANAAIASDPCAEYEAEVAAGMPARRVALTIGNNDAVRGVNNA